MRWCLGLVLLWCVVGQAEPVRAEGGEGLRSVRMPSPAAVPVFPPTWAPAGMDAPERPGKSFGPGFVRGVAVGLYTETPELDYDRSFAEIKALGATHVSIVTAWSQAHIRAVEIAPDPVETPSDDKLLDIIATARRHGLEVMLFPIIHLKRRRSGEWRGKLAPAHPERWWRSYEQFVLHHASLAERGGVAVFSVGSELLSMEQARDRWVSLVADVREVYRGSLIYSANWDHYHGVTFWDQIDLVGMTGYFELAKDASAPYSELIKTWSAATSVIASYAALAGKPLILTEVGYPSQVGGALHPWDYTRDAPPDGRTQYLAYRAMYEAWLARARNIAAKPGLSGVFFWSWNGYGGPADGHYTPRGKPATALIKRWFLGR